MDQKTVPCSLSLVVALAFSFGLVACSASRPKNLGIQPDGKLLPCPKTPNCVSSFEKPEDNVHFIEALTSKSKNKLTLETLKSVLESQPRVHFVSLEKNYIHAEFTTLIMRYIDDVEFLYNEKEGVFQVRSASRIGKSDLGTNRKRIEKIRSEIESVSTN